MFGRHITDILDKKVPLAVLETLPVSAAITDVRIFPDVNYRHVSPLTPDNFRQLLDGAKPVSADSELIFAWHYAPWCKVSFSTAAGKHELKLYLGGMGFLKLPDGRVGALRFEHPK